MFNWKLRAFTAQVCVVNKCLFSVSRLNAAGQRVVLDGKDRYIQDKKTGENIAIQCTHGVYHLDVWVRTRGGKTEMQMGEAPKKAQAGFHRQG